jgi:hypothetical protein
VRSALLNDAYQFIACLLHCSLGLAPLANGKLLQAHDSTERMFMKIQ